MVTGVVTFGVVVLLFGVLSLLAVRCVVVVLVLTLTVVPLVSTLCV